jgi:molybdopterin-guanine dinucleotide biosynthesis protein A
VSRPSFAAVILAGGTATRLSGTSKSALELDGRTLLQHALKAVRHASPRIVVGDPVDVDLASTFVREDPAYGGPAAALLTGVEQIGQDDHEVELVLVLAVDMPRVTRATVDRLLSAAQGNDGAALVDTRGRRQLAMALDVRRLRSVAPPADTWHGLPIRVLLADLDLSPVQPIGDEGRDVDTWADLNDLRD